MPLRWLIAWTLFAICGVLALPAQIQSPPTPDALSQAHAMHQSLLLEPVANRTAAEYERIVAVLEPVWQHPGESDADSARFEAASLYVAEARDLRDPAGYAKAARGFLDLLHASPYTAYRRNAEWALAQIQIFHLREPRAAAVWLRDFMRRYPADLRVPLAHQEVAGRRIAEPPYWEPGELAPLLPPVIPPPARAPAESSPPAPASAPAAEAGGGASAPRGRDLNLRSGLVSGIHVFTNSRVTSIVILLRSPASFSRGAIPERHLVYFDIGQRSPRARPESEERLEVNDGRVASIRVGPRPGGVVRVVIESANRRAQPDRGRFFPNPARLVVAVSGGAAAKGDGEGDPATPPRPATALRDGATSLTRALGLKIACIVIDAGHGGHDTGTVASDGLEEKTVVLDVAQRLGVLLRRRLGVRVVYTRDDDTFISLDERTAIANRDHADLFVSVHANSNPDPGATGVETYYLDLTNNAQAMAVARRENAGSDADVHDLASLLRKIALNDKMQESHELARDVETSLSQASGQPDRGVKTAPFVVLIGARMPSVLAEIAFLSNRADALRLALPAYRERLAEGLYQGLARYIHSLSAVGTAVAARPAPAVK